MKKISFLILLLAVQISVIPALAQESATLSLSSVDNAAPGDEVIISLELSDNPGVTALKFTPDYDQSILEFTGIDHSSKDSVFPTCTKATSGEGVLCMSLGNTDENGKILDLKFKVLGTAASGKSKVTIGVTDGDMKNYDKETITPQISEGYVTVVGSLPPAPVLPTSITLNPSGTSSVESGKTLHLTATVLPANADDKTVIWESSDPTVATVDVNGNVAGVAEGNATITVTSNAAPNVTAQIWVNVTAPVGPQLPTSITLKPSGTTSVKSGKTIQIRATVLPANAADKTVTWQSSDPAVATVDANGRVTGVAEGTATITVISNADPNVITRIQVTVTAPVSPQPQPRPQRGLNFWRFDIVEQPLPRTGFSAFRPQTLPSMPLDLKYQPLRRTLEIPSLSVSADMVEVPNVDGEYPITWLGDKVGLLEGFAMPGEGYTVLTGHNHLNTTEAGPFALLSFMEEGDRIFVRDANNGLKVYVVYANEKVSETDYDAVESIAVKYDGSLTMITCEDERVDGGYANRRIVAARLY